MASTTQQTIQMAMYVWPEVRCWGSLDLNGGKGLELLGDTMVSSRSTSLLLDCTTTPYSQPLDRKIWCSLVGTYTCILKTTWLSSIVVLATDA